MSAGFEAAQGFEDLLPEAGFPGGRVVTKITGTQDSQNNLLLVNKRLLNPTVGGSAQAFDFRSNFPQPQLVS